MQHSSASAVIHSGSRLDTIRSIPLINGPLLIYGTTDVAYSIPIAMLTSAFASAVFGLIALRTAGAYFIMITLAFNQMLFYLFVALERYGGDEGLQISTKLHFASIPIGSGTSLFRMRCRTGCGANFHNEASREPLRDGVASREPERATCDNRGHPRTKV